MKETDRTKKTTTDGMATEGTEGTELDWFGFVAFVLFVAIPFFVSGCLSAKRARKKSPSVEGPSDACARTDQPPN